MANLPEPLYKASSPRKDLFCSWKRLGKACRCVAVVDFGTTRTGLLIALKKRGSHSPDIFTPDWDEEHGSGRFGYNVKTDSSILLGKDGSFKAFGKQARELALEARSKTLEAVGDYWLFFQHFKMQLHSPDTDLDTATVTALNGQRKPAKLVFTAALKHLKEKALATLSPEKAVGSGCVGEFSEFERDYGLPIPKSGIRWVITVPAIWSEKAKGFMRKCAMAAGMVATADQLTLLYEPEAASIAMQFHLRDEEEKWDAVYPSEGGKRVLIQTGDVYMILDCGGGTVDIVAHQWLGSFEVREVIAPTGGRWGSIYVEEEFQNLFDELFGDEPMAAFRKAQPSAWLRQMRNCVKAKEAFHKRKEVEESKEGEPGAVADASDDDSDESEDEVMHNIELIDELVSFFTLKKMRKSAKAYRKRMGASRKRAKIVGRDTVYLMISEELMASMFDVVISQMIAHVMGLLSTHKRELFVDNRLRYVFIVGGFAESRYLERRVCEALECFEGLTVMVPDTPGLAVVRGAANIEHIRSIVKARILRHTYGRRVALPKTEVMKWSTKPFIGDRVFIDEMSGDEYVEDCFEVIAKMGDCIECGHSVSLRSVPATATLSSAPAEVYFSDVHTANHLLPTNERELLKHAVGGKKVCLPFPHWFDAGKGEMIDKFTFAEERELQLEVTLECDGRTQTVAVDPFTYECFAD